MQLTPFNLASSGDSDVIKYAAIVVGLIVWGISAMVSAAKKATEQARRRAGYRAPTPAQARQTFTSASAPQKRIVPGGFSVTTQQRAQALAQMTARPAPAQKLAPRPAPAPARPGPGSLAPVTMPAAAAVKLVPHGSSAGSIRRWLRPASLRKQFIITELLQPPIALRSQPEQ